MNPADARGREGGLLIPVLLTAVGLAVLIGLGVWQLERKAWKDGLAETLLARLGAAPTPLPSPGSWNRLNQADDEYRRVTFPAEFLHRYEALAFTSGSTLRPDVSGPGYWVLTPARLPGGSIVMVDRGFVPETKKDAATRAEGQVSGMGDMTGALRWPEQRGSFTPADEPAKNLWFTRDPASIAAAKGIGPVAPFYVALEDPAAPGGLPRVGKLRPNLPNNHLQYALTWFGLALTLAGVFAAWLLRRRRGESAA
jgi:surfeit locus 1 family protein